MRRKRSLLSSSFCGRSGSACWRVAEELPRRSGEPRVRAAMARIKSKRFLEQRLRVRQIAAPGVDVGEEDERVGRVRRVVEREFQLADSSVEFAAIRRADAAQNVRARE